MRRIDRFIGLLHDKGSYIHFIRGESKAGNIKDADISAFTELMDSFGINYDLTLILWNAVEIKFHYRKVFTINDTSEFESWRRERTNWAEIFDVLQARNIIDLSMMKRYRSKIAINFHQSGKLLTEYDDEISSPSLISVANTILRCLKPVMFFHEFLNYMVIEASQDGNNYAVKIVFMKNPAEDYVQKVLSLIDPRYIISYNVDRSRCISIGKRRAFDDEIDGLRWSHRPESFIQPIPEVGRIVRETIGKWLIPGSDYIGLGGESGYFGLKHADHLAKQILMTSSPDIFSDYVENHRGRNTTVWQIDYGTFDFTIFQEEITSTSILLINISRTGLGKMMTSLLNRKFKQILYIGCSERYVWRDVEQLLSQYRIKNMLEIKLPNGNSEYVFDLR